MVGAVLLYFLPSAIRAWVAHFTAHLQPSFPARPPPFSSQPPEASLTQLSPCRPPTPNSFGSWKVGGVFWWNVSSCGCSTRRYPFCLAVLLSIPLETPLVFRSYYSTKYNAFRNTRWFPLVPSPPPSRYHICHTERPRVFGAGRVGLGFCVYKEGRTATATGSRVCVWDTQDRSFFADSLSRDHRLVTPPNPCP